MKIEPGTRIGPYTVGDKLGEGGMGVVWEAEDARLERKVALKALPEGIDPDPSRVERFSREARLLASLNHPHIAGLYGLEEKDGQRYLVMERVFGEDLSARLQRGPLPVEEALELARQMADALEVAHENGVIHRDLKPANVLITGDGQAKLLDFGLAKAFELDAMSAAGSMSPTLTTPATQAGVILGTAAYMSPEQAKGRQVDRRADIWSFGVVLYEMLSGRRLFQGEATSEVLAAVLRDEPDWSALPGNTPERVRHLVERCLRRDPRTRLRDIGDARLLLEEVKSGGFAPGGLAPADPAAAASPAGEAPSSPAPSRRFMAGFLPWTLAALSLAGMAAALLGLFGPVSGPDDATPVVRFSMEEPLDYMFMSGEVLAEHPAVAMSPDGTMMAYTLMDEGRPRIWVRSMDAFEGRPLAGTEDGSNPVFSPDGSWLAFEDSFGLKKISVQGGAALMLTGTPGNFRGATWSDDGSIIVSLRATSPLERIPPDGGPLQPLTQLDEAARERTHRWPHALPGGRHVLFTVGTLDSAEYYDDASIHVVDVATGERREVLRGASMARYLHTGHLLHTREGTLFAAPFDLESLQVTGPSVPVLDDLLTFRNSGAAHFSVSARGDLIYMTGQVTAHRRLLGWMSRDGQVEVLPLEEAIYLAPQFSPDGSRLLIGIVGKRSGDLWSYDIRRGVTERLTFNGVSSSGVWSADGQWIYFVSPTPESHYGLYRRPADGSGERELLLQDEAWFTPECVSADGGTLFLRRTSLAGSSDIMSLDLTRDQAMAMEAIQDTRFNESAASISPDGRWLAYVSDESGRPEVYVKAMEGAGKWQVSINGGREPSWGRTSEELFFMEAQHLYRVPVNTAEGFRVAAPEQLLERPLPMLMPWGASYAYRPQGDRFVMMMPAPGDTERSSAEVKVVLNWARDLERLLP